MRLDARLDSLFLRFYLAVTSRGRSWLALPHEVDTRVQPIPVLFAWAARRTWDERACRGIPARRRYLIKDVARKAHGFGVPIDAPFAHPFNPLLALRIASLPMADIEQAKAIDVLYRATWVQRVDVTQPHVVASALRTAGLDPSLVDRAGATDAKERVRAQTNDAIALGVFGVPTMLVDDEMFWGTDSMGDLELFLQGSNPVTKDLVDRWESLPAAASRPRSPRSG